MTQAERQQTTIQLDALFEALQQPLSLVSDPERREQLQRYLEAARTYQEKAVFDLLSDVAGKVNETSGDTRVRLEYQAREFQLVVEPRTDGQAEAESLAGMDTDEVEKVTIRMPAALKQRIDEAAKVWGVSVNTWYVRTLARSVWHEMRHRHRTADAPMWGGRRGGRRGGGRGLRGMPEDPA